MDAVCSKIPQLNTLAVGDFAQFVDSNNVAFLAKRVKDHLALENGTRVTFSSVAPLSAPVTETVAEEPEVIEPASDVSEAVVELTVEQKLAAKRLKDKLRKQASRAAAKQKLAA